MQTENLHSAPEGIISKKFPKEERLCSKKLITELFSKGSSFNLYPLRFVFLPASLKDVQPAETPAFEFPQVLISVSKKYFKHAVDRNLLKRRIRESYRLNKHLFQTENRYLIAYLGIIYIGKEKKPYNSIDKKLKVGLLRLVEEQR